MKQWLGIEGVKLELVIPEGFAVEQGQVSGLVRLTSKNPQSVSAIKIGCVEKYTRGRNEEVLVDEYELGSTVIRRNLEVPGEGVPIDVPFTVRLQRITSPVEEFGGKNVLFKGLAWVAKKTRNASSEFRVEAEAQVRGMGLNPFDKRILEG